MPHVHLLVCMYFDINRSANTPSKAASNLTALSGMFVKRHSIPLGKFGSYHSFHVPNIDESLEHIRTITPPPNQLFHAIPFRLLSIPPACIFPTLFFINNHHNVLRLQFCRSSAVPSKICHHFRTRKRHGWDHRSCVRK